MFDKDCLNYHNICWRYSWSPENPTQTLLIPLPVMPAACWNGCIWVKSFTKTGFIILTFCADIHGPQKMNPTHFSDLLTFCLTPPASCNCCILVKMSDSYQMNYHKIWCRYSCPQEAELELHFILALSSGQTCLISDQIAPNSSVISASVVIAVSQQGQSFHLPISVK